MKIDSSVSWPPGSSITATRDLREEVLDSRDDRSQVRETWDFLGADTWSRDTVRAGWLDSRRRCIRLK